MNKRSIKLVEVILACCCLGIKDNRVLGAVVRHVELNPGRHTVDLDLLVVSLAYYGYLYLLSIFALSAISGQPPKGFYIKFFNILGAVLYILAEMLLMASEWTVIYMFGLVFAIMLVVILILDGLEIVF